MELALWIATGLLAVAFAAAGTVKLVTPRTKLLDQMPWAADVTDGQVKAIGGLEVAGAIGLILPAVVGVAPVLVPLAAIGLGLTMVGALVVHARRGDGFAAMAPSLVLLALCLFVAWGRLGPYAF